MKKVEEAFAKTAKLLFGGEIGQLKRYVKWLERNVQQGRWLKKGKANVYVPHYGIFRMMPEGTVVPEEEFASIGEGRMNLAENETVRSLGAKFSSFARYTIFLREGDNMDVVDCTFYKNLVHGYRVLDAFDNKCIACSLWSDFG